jgi:putative aminopeptidase FrvX
VYETIKSYAEKVAAIPSVSGFEEVLADLVVSLLDGKIDSVARDRMGNVVAEKAGFGAKKLKVLVEAHMDQIGLMITKVEENGVLRFTNVGGINPVTLFGKRVRVLGRETIYGVIGMKPPHIATEEELSEVESLDKLYIDIGLDSKSGSERFVEVGDTAVLDYTSSMLMGDHFCSSGLDNKAGVLTLLAFADLLAVMKTCHDLSILFSVQEEVGLRGAKVAGYSISPDVALVCDVTFADPMGSGTGSEIVTGRGPAVSKGPGYYPPLVKRMREIAGREDIPVQEEIEARPGGTDAYAIQTTRRGVYTGGISVPLRYMHSQTEIINIKDVYRASRLLAHLVMEPDLLGQSGTAGGAE